MENSQNHELTSNNRNLMLLGMEESVCFCEYRNFLRSIVYKMRSSTICEKKSCGDTSSDDILWTPVIRDDASKRMVFVSKNLDNVILTTFFSLITCHHWIVETHMDVFRPRHPDSEAKNTEKWADRRPHAAFAAKNH